MPFTYTALERWFAQGISTLTECNAPDLSVEAESARGWVTEFIMRTIFHGDFPDDIKPLVFTMIRRASMAVIEYQSGRSALIEY
ncbi:MAG TPA: hypothetical protein VL379_04560, partial [Pseudomonadales bacterium]|nr:hypothetical protein [Pseudomonadales bacterium]